MRAYVVDSGLLLSPFNEPAGAAARVLNVPLAERQAAVFARLGLETERVDSIDQVPAGNLAVFNHVFFTRRAAASFLRAATGESVDCVLALPDSAFCRNSRPLQDDLIVEKDEGGKDRYVYGVFFVRQPAATVDELRARARRIVLPLKEKVFRPPNLEILGQTDTMDLSYALTRFAVLHVCHWSHVLDVHFQALFERWFDVGPLTWLSYLARAATALSFNKWKIARRLTIKGRRCDIHPTAVVEASVLGDGVRVGPYAVVRGSVIGDRVKIDEHSEIMFSAIGDRSICAWRARANFSVVYRGAIISYPAVQTCVIGDGAAHTGGAYPIDMKLDFTTGNLEVPVLHHGKVVGSGKQFLGACLGHRAIVGTGQWLTCGLEVPNGAFLVRDPLNVVKKIPEGVPPGEPMAVRDGRVIALRGAPKESGEKP